MSRRRRLLFEEQVRENNQKILTNLTNKSIIRERYNIGIIIPTTSNKKNYKKLEDYIFFQITLSSFIKTCSNDNNYNFYLGYDDDDLFFTKNKDKLIDYFNEKTPSNFTVKFYEMKNLKGKVGKIWSNLADVAKETNEYLYQIGDDIEMMTNNWDRYFIYRLLQSDNVGCVGPYDLNIKCFLLTQSFVHIKHLEIFGTYFPDKIINWDIDLWITQIYGSNPVFGIEIKNQSGFSERYEPVNDKNNYRNIKNKDLVILNDYLKRNKALNIYYLNEDTKKYNEKDIKLTIGILALTKRKLFLIRLLNKISWCSGDYRKKLEIIINEDNGEKTIGTKRNEIIRKSSGEYFCFIDDDDIISDNYFELIFDAFKENPDGVGFKGMYYEKEFSKMVFEHNFDNKTHFKNHNIQKRPLNHLKPIKTELVRKIPYKEINYGEDLDFGNRVKNLLKSGKFINYILYHYLYDPQK